MTIDNEINDTQREAVDEMRKRMKGDMDQELYEDTYLFLRFLKARDFDLDKSEDMLRKHIAWREKYDVKNALKFKKTEVMEKYFVNITIGYDKVGHVVRYAPLGGMDFVGLFSSLTSEEFTSLIIYECEADTLDLKKQSQKLGKNVDKCVYIYDCRSLSFATASNKKVLYNLIFFLNLYVNNYPERLRAAYVLNVPIYFSILWNVVKSMLPKTILDKIHVYSDDSYKGDLLEVIDKDVLPAFLGGSRKDPDGNPLCLTVIPASLPVPQSFYLQTNKRSLAKAPGAKKVTLSRAAFHEAELEVKEAGSYLEWEFETKCRDIGFGLFYNEIVDGEERITELVPIQRIDTEEYPETGTFLCERSGKYVIVFDNTYSWVRAKEIYYRTKVVTPEEHKAQIKQ